jgi:hypothetical protein
VLRRRLLGQPIAEHLPLGIAGPAQRWDLQPVDLVVFLEILDREFNSTSRVFCDQLRNLARQAGIFSQDPIDFCPRLADRPPPTLTRIDSRRVRELDQVLYDPRDLALNAHPERIAQILDLLGEVLPVQRLV